MAVELAVWLIVAGLGIGAFIFGGITKQTYIFVLGCALLIGAGGLLWGFNGLLLDHQPTSFPDVGGVTTVVYTDVVVSMENIGLVVLAMVFVAIGVLSMFVIDFAGAAPVRRNTYHY